MEHSVSLEVVTVQLKFGILDSRGKIFSNPFIGLNKSLLAIFLFNRCIQTILVHTDSVWALLATENFTYLISGGRDKKVS